MILTSHYDKYKIIYMNASLQINIYLPWLEVVLHAVLEAFSFGFEWCHDQAVTHEMSWITNTFTGPKATEKGGGKETTFCETH